MESEFWEGPLAFLGVPTTDRRILTALQFGQLPGPLLGLPNQRHEVHSIGWIRQIEFRASWVWCLVEITDPETIALLSQKGSVGVGIDLLPEETLEKDGYTQMAGRLLGATLYVGSGTPAWEGCFLTRVAAQNG